MGKKVQKTYKLKILQPLLAMMWIGCLNIISVYVPASPLSHLSFVVIIGLILYSIFGYSSFVKKISSLKLDEAEQLMIKEQAAASENFYEYLKDLESDIRLLYLFMTVYFLLASSLVAFSSPASRIPYSLISYYIIWLILEIIIRKKADIFAGKTFLSREEYPNLYSIADKAFEGTGLEVKILCPGGSSIGGMRQKHTVYITIGAYNFSILSDSEILSLFLHERFYLYDLSKTSMWKAEPLSKLTPADFSTILIPATVLIQYPLTRISHSYAIADIATTSTRERMALHFINDKGLSESFASGAAKIKMLYFFDNIETRNHVMFYETETMRSNIVSLELKYFRRVFEVRKDYWCKLLKGEIPDYGNYRLSYSQTCEELKTTYPEITLEDGTEKERASLLDYADKLVAEGSRGSYSKDRQNWYLNPKKVLEEYDNALLEGKTYSAIELRPVLDACDALNLDDRLIDLCTKAIEESTVSNQAAHAHYLLGRELLHGYDKAGLEHVLFAMDVNENYIREGSEMIEAFCRLMGLEDELNYYARRIREITQLAADRNLLLSNEITPGDKLTADTSIPEALSSENINFIVKCCGEGLTTIWQLRKELAENYYSTVYIVQFDPSVSQECIDEAGKLIFNYLDGQTRHYGFLLREECPIDPDTIPDSCVYKK